MAQGNFSKFDSSLNVGSAALPCSKRKRAPAPPTHWIEIELVDEDGDPCPGEKYIVTCPDGSEKTGVLNQLGFSRVPLEQPGTCKVSFPNLDKESWEPSTT